MVYQIQAPTRLIQPIYQAELGISPDKLIALEHSGVRGPALEQIRELRGDKVMIDQPRAWRLDSRNTLLLVQIVCSFLPAQGHKIESARLEARFRLPTQPIERFYIHDIYPRDVGTEGPPVIKTVWGVTTKMGFRLVEERPTDGAALRIDNLRLVPKIRTGRDASGVIWDFISFGNNLVEGCRVEYLILELPPFFPELMIRFAFSAIVDTPLMGLLPFTVRQELTGNSQYNLDLHTLPIVGPIGKHEVSDDSAVPSPPAEGVGTQSVSTPKDARTVTLIQKQEEDMSRKAGLEELIRDSHGVIRGCEQIIQTGRPTEKLECRRTIKAQWDNIERYLGEYRRIVGDALPADIAQIAAHFGPVAAQTASSRSDQAQPSQGSTTYNIHIQHASGMAIGDRAQVTQSPPQVTDAGSISPDTVTSASAASAGWSSAAIRRLLSTALDDERLMAFCYDHFRDVYEGFSVGMSKGQKVQRLLEHCERCGQLDRLLSLVREQNPVQYDQVRSQLR